MITTVKVDIVFKSCLVQRNESKMFLSRDIMIELAVDVLCMSFCVCVSMPSGVCVHERMCVDP